MAAAAREGGYYRTPSHIDGPVQRMPRLANLEARAMDRSMTHSSKNSVEPWLRRTWTSVTPMGRAVWEHMKHNWTDAFIALGFVAVMLLSVYLLFFKN